MMLRSEGAFRARLLVSVFSTVYSLKYNRMTLVTDSRV